MNSKSVNWKACAAPNHLFVATPGFVSLRERRREAPAGSSVNPHQPQDCDYSHKVVFTFTKRHCISVIQTYNQAEAKRGRRDDYHHIKCTVHKDRGRKNLLSSVRKASECTAWRRPSPMDSWHVAVQCNVPERCHVRENHTLERPCRLRTAC